MPFEFYKGQGGRKCETTPIKRPPKIEPKRNRVVTISKNLKLSYMFDYEINEYLEQGWKLNKIEVIKLESEIVLVGFLQRY